MKGAENSDRSEAYTVMPFIELSRNETGKCNMKEFIEKLIGRLEEKKTFLMQNVVLADVVLSSKRNALDRINELDGAIEIVNQLAEEYNNDFCEWEYDDFEDVCQPSCGTTFSLCDSDKEITHYCPYCGKEIKVVE